MLASVIDANYRGPIKVLEITHGQRITQIICEKVVIPTITVIDTLTKTVRNSDGFGSTEINDTSSTSPSHTTEKSPSPHIPYNIIPYDGDEITTSTPTHKPIDNIIGVIQNMTTRVEPPFHISLSFDPFDDIVDIEIST